MKTGFLLKFLALPFLVPFGETPRALFSANISFWCIRSQSEHEGIKRTMEMKNKNYTVTCQELRRKQYLLWTKSIQQGSWKSTSHPLGWFIDPLDFCNIHRHLLTNVIPPVLL